MPIFHEGELALQSRTGVLERLAPLGPRMIRDHMPDQHRDFFALLPFLIVGSVDAHGQPWASVLAGPPGFAASPHARVLEVGALPQPHDALAGALHTGSPLGLLGIQPHTRRRNRMNGRIEAVQADGFRVRVDQSFGNCPKYIQAREATHTGGPMVPSSVERMDVLDEDAVRLVRGADTFYIASTHPGVRSSPLPELGVDVSHRGGKPGFVRVEAGGVLTVPDFTGNSYFNTLGNLLLEPRCGLLFIDHEEGHTLQVAARARIVEDGAELAGFRGALRLVRLEMTSAIRARGALPLRWGPAQLSPVLEATGTW